MAEYIKLNNEWKEILGVYKKINGEWVLQTDINSSILASNIYIYSSVKIDNVITYIISGDDSYTGKTFNLAYIYNNRSVIASWEIISGSEYASINSNGKVTIEPGISNEVIIVRAEYKGNILTKTITISYDNQLEIEGAETITGTLGNVIGRFNNSTVNPEWSITTGSSLASIDNRGNIIILDSGNIVVQAVYHGYTATKQIELVYDNNTTTETVIDEYNNITTTTTSTEVDQETGSTTTRTTTNFVNDDGSSIITSSEVIENQDGSSITTSTTTNSNGTIVESTVIVSAPDSETGAITTTKQSSIINSDSTTSEINYTLTENQDGSSESVYSTTNYDENGNLINSAETEITNNSDGSFSSSTTNYDENNNPIDKTNSSSDVEGNSFMQNLVYNDNGDPVVTEYNIGANNDTGYYNSDGANGIDTEYYAFDLTHGFELNLHFTIDFTAQPPNQNDGHHNILNMKRASPSPWYGLQIRHSSTNKYIQLGTQFATGGNTNETITTANANKYNGSSDVYEYNIRIVYNPILSSGQFVCDELIGETFHKVYNNIFPDLDELKYITTTIGCALDQNGNPFRYSNINIFNFSIKKLRNIENPVITCNDGQTITITCATEGSTIYYKLKDIASYSEYTEPISIHEDTFVQTYSQLDDEKSEVIMDYIIYDNGIEEPEVDTINNAIVITCETSGTTIYYRLNQTGHYEVYTEPIDIEEDTLIETYAQLNGERSDIISVTCLYDNGIETPIITCNGEIVTINCADTNSIIYYRLNETGSYSLYESGFEIFENTTVEAYVELNGVNGHIATEYCIYEPIIINNPVIFSNGPSVTITCSTNGAEIYYKVNQSNNYSLYTGPIPISDDTVIQAYSKIKGKMSSIVTENCIYSNIHNYSLDYLTFRILSDGVIPWKANTTTKTIEYSLNNGAWTQITSTSNGVTINVLEGDVIRFRGTNTSYCSGQKAQYSGFGLGESGSNGDYFTNAASFDVEGNIMSLIYGDNFTNQTSFNSGIYQFCSLFKKAKVVSAENLILPVTTLTEACYRAMFSWCTYLTIAPQLPATTLASYCYWYMFENTSIVKSPDLLTESLTNQCYGHMFEGCNQLNFIKCLAINRFNSSQCLADWVKGVANSGTFIREGGVTSWPTGNSGIPSSWVVYSNVNVEVPEISFDGFNIITLSCETVGANIYYKLNKTGNYLLYNDSINITSDTFIQTYSELNGEESRIVSKNCIYVSDVPIEESNRDLKYWNFSGNEIKTPYSVNAVDGHSASYAKGTFTFETSFNLRNAKPAQLWFQHADQSAEIYIDNTLVTKHWGGYTSFNVDISNYVHAGTNNVKVILKNNEGNNLAPASADFNFNATLGNVKLLTSPCIPEVNYGYDGFHIASTVTDALATINIKTTVPTGASVVCTIDDGTYNCTDTQVSDGTEMTFTNNISNPHLWNGKADPYLYNITLEIYKDNILYHRFVRPYGFRYYEYVINDTTILANEDPYTGFLLNGQPYLLRGCCMHDDIDGKANALDESDYNQTFAIIQELNCNFLRLAHYPHPKEVYDRCDELGIIVQTEGPCVNKMQTTMPTDYFTHLETQYADMTNQHMNHPCIIFWGLSNETQVDDKDFAKTKVESYSSIIKGIHPEAWVGYVLAQSTGQNPSTYYNNPDLDWFGSNMYVGWYDSPNNNKPVSQLNTRIANTITSKGKMLAYSEYGCGGTQICHSDNPLTTTTRGNNARHDIEYMMWLHEGQIETIKNYPELVFTSQWQLFDIAVSNRNEGYTVCLDGETSYTDDSLRRLNNKGLVERDHKSKKDTFYLYKAWWNTTPFIHICSKTYGKLIDRVIKCYTNLVSTDNISLYVNNVLIETVNPSNYMAVFTAITLNDNDIIKVSSGLIEDTFIITEAGYYENIEYISSTATGGQYIDLGCKLMETTDDIQIDMKFNIHGYGVNTNKQPSLLTSKTEINPYPGFVLRSNIGNDFEGVTLSANWEFNSNTAYHDGRYEDKQLTYNEGSNMYNKHLTNQIIEYSVNIENIPSEQCNNMNTHLFCALDVSNNPFRFCLADLYYLKITKNNVLIRDLIPVKKVTQNSIEIGLFDKVNRVLYDSDGANPFIAGPKIY